MKRYAIIRVDGNHKPSYFEVERIENIADLKLLDNVVKTYGDTKEQLINKIETAIKRKLKGGYSVTYRKFGKGYIKDSVSARELAESIVEFLGVEDDKEKRRR